MQTKFSVFCERLMEAGWLLAAVSVPLFFDIYSSRVFEPDKITLLRSIALVVALAWLAKFIETGFADFRSGSGSFLRRLHQANPLSIPVMLLVLIYLVSTLASVAEPVSIAGSYQRLQGTYSMFSYIVIFGAMLHSLKTRTQLQRLYSLIILTSLPIAAYGWIQHFRLDPLPWGGDVSERIASAEGNSIFVGAYLIMVVPLTFGRWLNIVAQVLREPGDEASQRNGTAGDGATRITPTVRPPEPKRFNDSPYLVLAGCYTFILAFQLLAIFWTFSRGAWIGFLAGMFVFLFVFGVRRRVTWLWSGSLTLAVVGIAFLLAINLPGSPLTSFRDLPGIGRLGTIFEESGTNIVRFLIWDGASELVAPHDPIGFGPYTDVLNPIRPLIGYGPESMYVAYNRFYPPDLAHYEARNASPDRSHNETFDSLVTTGFIGFLIYLFLFGSVFYFGFKWLGLAGERRDLYLFIACWVIGGAIGAAIPFILQGRPRMMGVALPVGLLFGVLTYLVIQALVLKRRVAMPPLDEDQIMLMALIGAIVAHFAEIHFGIAIGSTRTYFWLYVALLVLIGYRMRQRATAEAAVAAEASRPQKVGVRMAAFTSLFAARTPAMAGAGAAGNVYMARKRRRDKVAAGARGNGAAANLAQMRAAPVLSSWTNAVIVYGLLLGVILQIMVFNFISPNLTGNANMNWILALFAFTLVVTTLAATAQVQAQFGDTYTLTEWLTRFLLILVIASAVLGLYALIHVPRLTPRAGLDAVTTIGIVADTITVFYLFFFAMLLMLAVFLMQDGRLPVISVREPFFLLIYLALLVVGVLGIKISNLDSIRADIFYKQGLNFDNNQQWDGSIAMYREAINLQPDQDFYYLFYGRAFLEKAKTVSDAKQRASLLETARTELIRARDLNPLNTDHTANLARLYRTWAELSSDPAQRSSYLNESLKYYEQAETLSPHNAQIINEYGSVYALIGQTDQALAKYQQSLGVDDQFAQTYLLLGDLYQSKQEPDKAIQAYQSAAKYDEAAANNALGNLYINRQEWDNAAGVYQKILEKDPNNLQAHSALGLIYSRQSKWDQAINENLIVASRQPNDLSSLRNLALLYQQVGKYAEALQYAQRTLAVTPDNEKPQIQALIQQLQQQLQGQK